ncbi:hypothetical protein K1I93_09770, partial [Streptococcus australis]|nr:hypothetical protein [Streptococcus australis]
MNRITKEEKPSNISCIRGNNKNNHKATSKGNDNNNKVGGTQNVAEEISTTKGKLNNIKKSKNNNKCDDNNINNDEYNNIDQYHHCGDTIKQKETPSIAHKIKHEAISENDMNSEKSYSSQLLYEDKLYYMLNNNSLENLNYTVIEKDSSNVKNIQG